MLNCQQATRLLSDAQEIKLPLKERVILKFHVMMCSGCRNFGNQMGSLREIAHQYAKGKDTLDASEDLEDLKDAENSNENEKPRN